MHGPICRRIARDAYRKSLKTAHAGQPSFLPCQSKPALPRKPGRAFAHLISPDEKRRLMNPRPSRLAIAFAATLFLSSSACFFLPRRTRAQDMETEITATARVFPDVGPGIRAIKRDAHGRYYFLSTVDHSVRVYRVDNSYLGKIPRAPSRAASIVYGQDMDVDAAGNVYVADRGANRVKVYTPDGRLSLSIAVEAPTSVVALEGGDIAVTSLKSHDLITVYDSHGRFVREFGDLSDLAEHEEFNRFLNLGRLATDPASHIYYAFTYSPEPTVRKYDMFGYSKYQISLHTLDIYPGAQAERRNIARIDLQSMPQPLPKVIDAIGVDPRTQEVWIAMGDDLMKFDKSGTRVARYRTLMPDGEDLNASAILIERHRILLADNPHGIFSFARPDLPSPQPDKTK